MSRPLFCRARPLRKFAPAFLLLVLSACSTREAVRDPGAGRIVTPQLPTVCFDMTRQEYESARVAGEIRGDHDSCDYFARFLEAAGSWYIADMDRHTEAYQLFYLPPFWRPVLLRVVAVRGQSPTVSATRLSGAGGYETGEVDRTVSRPMSRTEWLQWTRLVEQLGFWRDESPGWDEPVVCIDGNYWLFEGSRFERGAGALNSVKHKVWYPYCPNPESGDRLWAAASFLFDLTQTYPRDP